ncbi:MAG: LuxR C-terminal-related transcriptional regulator [Oscillospiraceae bacterium]|jgi:LuxR family maltose regulon positive regulatory protein|nr:LuxR C-terminal-related transcriptional regulator [Oscillospiraceae bacterium]
MPTSIGGSLFRPRVNAVLAEAAQHHGLVLAVAGASYGKTQAVRDFLRSTKVISSWITLTENDNSSFRFWERFTYGVAQNDPVLAEKLRAFGFPANELQFARYLALPQEAGYADAKGIFVFDDVHVIHNSQVLQFIERSVQAPFPNHCTFLLARREPALSLASLAAKGRVTLLGEEVFRFTEAEIQAFFRQEEVPFAVQNIAQLHRATGGWPFAVRLLGLALQRTPNEKAALLAVKQNVFQMMEQEAYADFPAEVQKNLIELSLVSQLPLAFLRTLADANKDFFIANPQISAFLLFDSLSKEYRVHPLYLEFLTAKQGLLSEDEKRAIYRRAASWCLHNEFPLMALELYAKVREYGCILQLLLAYPVVIPRDTAEYFVRILEALEPPEGEAVRGYFMIRDGFLPRMLLDAGRFAQAEAMALEAVARWEASDAPYAAVLLYSCYNSLGHIKMHTSVKNHQYDFDQYYQKALGVFRRNPALAQTAKLDAPIGCAGVRSFACAVGVGAAPGEFDAFLQAAQNMSAGMAQVFPGFYAGYDDLAACELAFYRSQAEQVHSCAQQAIAKAQAKAQFEIEAMAVFYLLRWALLEGDCKLADRLLCQLRKVAQQPAFLNGQLFYDLITAGFYVQIHLPSFLPAWLLSFSSLEDFASNMPLRERILHALCLLTTQRYAEVLLLLQTPAQQEVDGDFLLGELIFSVLRAVARLHSGDESGALADFAAAYGHSQNGALAMPFLERGRDTCALVKLALKQTDCTIPRGWLKTIDLRAAAYAKKAAVVGAAFKKQHNVSAPIALTRREAQILGDLYQGLTRQEIAATRYVSINTVKTEIQALYAKLDVESGLEAIRIAVERGLV